MASNNQNPRDVHVLIENVLVENIYLIPVARVVDQFDH